MATQIYNLTAEQHAAIVAALCAKIEEVGLDYPTIIEQSITGGDVEFTAEFTAMPHTSGDGIYEECQVWYDHIGVSLRDVFFYDDNDDRNEVAVWDVVKLQNEFKNQMGGVIWS